MRRIAGQVVLLTGASRGIGAHVARELARAGAHVALVARSAPELEATAAELRAAGGRAVPIVADVTDAAAREALVARAERELGPVDVLVNNAGALHAGPLHRRTGAEVEGDVRLNVLAPIELTRLVLPGMLARRRGHVVQVASIAGKVAMPYFAIYTATKHALVGFNHALQAELAGTGVRASAVCPGFVSDEGMWARLGGRVHPALGISSPERVARAVADVLESGTVERIVNPMPIRPVAALWGAAPGLARAVYRLARIDPFLRRAAERDEPTR